MNQLGWSLHKLTWSQDIAYAYIVTRHSIDLHQRWAICGPVVKYAQMENGNVTQMKLSNFKQEVAVL